MSRILAILRRDIQHVRGNIIAMLICVGLAVMPSLYAWFNIAGGWDPYANTGQIKVALANSDEGLEGAIIPFHINAGERVVTELSGSTKIGYTVTSEDDAIDGVASGKYYAAVVIPKDFSTKLLSVVSQNPTHPKLSYYVNEKRNPIASIVTGKASTSVQTLVDEGFTEAVSKIATELMDELSALLNKDQVLSVASNLGNVLDDSLRSLHRTADDIAAYQGVVTSIRNVTDAANAIAGNNSLTLNAADMLSQAAGGVRKFGDAATKAEDAASSALDRGDAAVQDIQDAVNDAFNVADGKVGELVDALNRVDAVARDRREDLQTLYNALESLNGQVYSFSRDLDLDGRVADVDVQYGHTVNNDIDDLLSRSSNALAYIDDLLASNRQAINDIQSAQSNAAANRAELERLAAQARGGVDSVRSSYSINLSNSLNQMASSIESAASEANDASAKLRSKMDGISPLLSDASTDLKKLEDTLGNASKKITDSADKLDSLRKRLLEAVSSGNVELVRTIFGGDASLLIDFFTEPVQLDREPFFPVENNGSAMTPYYTTMALWVGGTLMSILFYTAVSKKALEETGASPRHAYFGRLGFYLMVGACQSTMLLLGDIFFLKVQCVEPALFMLTGWLASTVFINIVFSLATAFGDVGKAIGVFIMVIQVAGSGGTFPVQMLPSTFQTLYRFLPFVYSENAFRAAMFGTYGNDWLMSMGTLVLYLVPALLLGLVLSKPLVPINEWIEEKMEETKLM